MRDIEATTVIHWPYKAHNTLPQDVGVPCFDNGVMFEEKQPGLPMLLLGGYGENEIATRTAVRYLGEQGIWSVGAVLPFDELPPDEHAVAAACAEVPHVVGDYFREVASLPRDAPLPVIGHSQGGGVWALARKARPEGLGDAALWCPVSFNIPEAVQTSKQLRIAQFLLRFLGNGLQQNIFDRDVRIAAGQVLSQAYYDVRTGRFLPKVGFAVMQCGQRQAIEHVSAGFRVGILTGCRDGVFRAGHIQHALADSARPDEDLPELITIPGNHASLNTRAGLTQLNYATDFLLKA